MSQSPRDPYSTSNQDDLNPFAPPESLDETEKSPSANAPVSSEGLQEIPPVQASYVFSIALLILGLFVAGFTGIALFPLSWGIIGLPFAILRLFIHRSSISRAIRDGRYPGGVRFNYVYFFVSLVLGIFCFCAGVLVFFLFCTLIIYSAGGPARAFPFDNAIPWLIGANAILAIFTSLALNRMSVPRYQ